MADAPAYSHVVLVVTDDPYVQEEVRYGFPEEVAVVVVSDAREAWKLMKDGRPSAVVVALRAGSAGGFGLARDMSQRELLRDVPIFMLLERPQDEWLAQEAGAHVARTKPLEASELVAETMALLARTPALSAS